MVAKYLRLPECGESRPEERKEDALPDPYPFGVHRSLCLGDLAGCDEFTYPVRLDLRRVVGFPPGAFHCTLVEFVAQAAVHRISTLMNRQKPDKSPLDTRFRCRLGY
jgi:hypothetical protein